MNKFKTLLVTHVLPIIMLLAMPGVGFAEGWASRVLNSDFTTWLRNIDPHLQAVWALLHATAYIMGIWFFVGAFFKLKRYGEQRTMMSSHHSLGGPLVYLGVAVALFYLPTMMDNMITTLWTGEDMNSVLAQPLPATAEFQGMMGSFYNLLRVIGLVTFIRGLVILSKAGHENHQPGIVGKGLIHLFAGVLGLNIVGTVKVIEATLYGTAS